MHVCAFFLNNSQARYWLLLLVTLVLNIMFIIYFTPDEEEICPIFFSIDNGTMNPDFHEYVISTYILGSLYAMLVAWMLLEHFTVTWPHFVLPKILYTLQKLFHKQVKRYRQLSWMTK